MPNKTNNSKNQGDKETCVREMAKANESDADFVLKMYFEFCVCEKEVCAHKRSCPYGLELGIRSPRIELQVAVNCPHG